MELTEASFTLDPRGYREVWLGAEALSDGWRGSAKETRTSGSGQVMTAIHHGSATGALGYHGFKAGARDLYMPHLRKNVSGWDASLTVQNVGAINAQVTVHFYHSNGGGGGAGSYGPFSLAAGYSRELYAELPSGFEGSAWVHSDGADVVAAIHEGVANGRAMGYSAVP